MPTTGSCCLVWSTRIATLGLAAAGGVPLEEARAQALTDRDAGALLLRDAGVPHTYEELDAQPDLPRIVHAGRHLARPRRYIRGYALELEPAQLPDAAAAQAVRPGGASTPWVKIVGDWIDRELGDITPLWPADVLVEAVRRAHEAGARVGVHVFGEEALPDLIAAGVDSIEHGTGLDASTLDEVARRGIAVVPTMVMVSLFDSFADQATKYPMYAARMRRLQAECSGTHDGDIRRGRADLCRHRRWWAPVAWPRRRRDACYAWRRHAEPSTSSRPVRGKLGSGWGCPALSKERQPTSWSTTTTREST